MNRAVKRYLITQIFLPLSVIALTAFAARAVFAPTLGYYSDDWGLPWLRSTAGAQAVILNWAIDRPVFGIIYNFFFDFIGNQPPYWHLLGLGIQLTGAAAVYMMLKILWPRERLHNLAIAILLLLYPGAVVHTSSAQSYTPWSLAVTAEYISILLSLTCARSDNRYVRILTAVLAGLTGIFSWITLELTIGMEMIRFLFLNQSLRRRPDAVRTHRILFGMLIVGFLIWRILIFRTVRPETDFLTLLSGTLNRPALTAIGATGARLLSGIAGMTVLAWFIPLASRLYLMRPSDTPAILTPGIICASVFLLYAGQVLHRKTKANRRPVRSGRIIIGLAIVTASLVPVVFGQRTAVMLLTYDRYAVFGALGAAVIITELLRGVVWSRYPAALALVIGMSATAYTGNAAWYARIWQLTKNFTWQMRWGLPGISPGTLIVADTYFHPVKLSDMELFAPVNYAYTPIDTDLKYPVLPLTFERAKDIRSGKRIEYRVRNDRFTGDFTRTIIVVLPTEKSCLKIAGSPITSSQTLTPLTDSVRPFSRTDLISHESPDRTVPVLFGPEPADSWCRYYLPAARYAQTGDWENAAILGREALKRNLRPEDPAEWELLKTVFQNSGDPESAAAIQVSDAGYRFRQEYGYRETVCLPLRQLSGRGLAGDRSFLLVSDAVSFVRFALLKMAAYSAGISCPY
ncbi:hypothetical protein A2Z33_00065 [Candidatus Gottesmanbacteria bacterium RBG_16_52_11]|uniref:Glycosyltransferase RgtA/B/C/D-like domain-containing protein n=1 Tax=Candidatus Gottesmanbacteria bacterium RBG_16_52_11 TaxID=1798374 RepID=A0A1F5YN93_9BACT|nr:MAG: hypothetical protein A2Z33_00065 [Candidatus Gottesmanbacteria bacterium RBG_16_52_11]